MISINKLRNFVLAIIGIFLLSSTIALWAQTPQRSSPAPSSPEKSPSEITIMVVGDLLPESEFKTKMPPMDQLYRHLRSTFAEADIVFGNLEEPLTESEDITPYKNPQDIAQARDFVLRASHPAAASRTLKDAGFTLLGLANNHMMDYGEQGLRDTLAALQAVGLKTVGGGLNKAEAEKAEIIEVEGVRVALLSFSDVVPLNYGALENHPGIASSKDAAHLAAAIEMTRPQADYIILLMHWGGHATHQVIPRQTELAKLAIDRGADIVVGAHPHYLQGISSHQGKPIFYSIGNFQFPSGNPRAQQSCIVRLTLKGKKLDQLRVVPVWIEQGQPRIVDRTPQGDAILRDITSFSRAFGTTIENGLVRQPAVAQRP